MKFGFLLIQLLMTLCLAGNSQQVPPDKMPNGYYHGSDRQLLVVFLQVMNDTAIADFVVFQKYPRELLSDTLVYASGASWLGRKSQLISKENKYYVIIRKEVQLPGNKTITLESNETFYKKHIDVYKNMAYWHMFFSEYVSRNKKADALQRFYELERKYEVTSMANRLNHADFLKQIGNFKTQFE